MIVKIVYHEIEMSHVDLLDVMIFVSEDFCKRKLHNFLE